AERGARARAQGRPADLTYILAAEGKQFASVHETRGTRNWKAFSPRWCDRAGPLSMPVAAETIFLRRGHCPVTLETGARPPNSSLVRSLTARILRRFRQWTLGERPNGKTTHLADRDAGPCWPALQPAWPYGCRRLSSASSGTAVG